jgi:hypothetical protein
MLQQTIAQQQHTQSQPTKRYHCAAIDTKLLEPYQSKEILPSGPNPDKLQVTSLFPHLPPQPID